MESQAVDPVALIALASSIAAALSDAGRRRVPNEIILISLAANLTALAFSGEKGDIVLSASGFLLGLFTMIPLFSINALGGGDVKFMACVGCFVGPENLLILILISWISAGITAASMILVDLIRRRLKTQSGYLLPVATVCASATIVFVGNGFYL